MVFDVASSPSTIKTTCMLQVLQVICIRTSSSPAQPRIQHPYSITIQWFSTQYGVVLRLFYLLVPERDSHSGSLWSENGKFFDCFFCCMDTKFRPYIQYAGMESGSHDMLNSMNRLDLNYVFIV